MQAPALVISIYEARLYVQGKVESLGSDCIEKKMTPHHLLSSRAS